MVSLSAFLNGGPGANYLIDDAWFSDIPFTSGKAEDPNPADGAESVSPEVDELSWTNPGSLDLSGVISCDVWFTDNYPEYGQSSDDPNFTNYATKIVDNQSVESIALSELELRETYYWRVDCYDANRIDNPDEYPVIVLGKVCVDASNAHASCINFWGDSGYNTGHHYGINGAHEPSGILDMAASALYNGPQSMSASGHSFIVMDFNGAAHLSGAGIFSSNFDGTVLMFDAPNCTFTLGS